MSTIQDFSSQNNIKMDNHTQYLRQQFYELTLLKPYLIINYGTVDINEIGEERIHKFLSLNMEDSQYQNQMKKYIEEEVEHYHNIYMQPTLLDFKLIVAVISPILTFLLAIPFLTLATANIFIDITILIFIIILPVFFVLSLLNLFRDKALKGCITLLNFFVIKTVVVFIHIILFLIIKISTNLISIKLGIVNYILNSLLIIITCLLVYKYKFNLLNIMTGGLVYMKKSANHELSKLQSLLNISKEKY